MSFRKLPVAVKVMDKRGQGNQDILSKLCCLTVPKNFEREPFCVVFHEISGSKKVYG